MTSYTCESCKYTTTVNWIYQKHLKTQKHTAMQSIEASELFQYVCTYCSKKYASNSSLKKHNGKCASRIKHEEEAILVKERKYTNSAIRLEKEKENYDLILKIKEELKKEMKDQMKQEFMQEMKEELMQEMKEEMKSQLALQLQPTNTVLDISANIANTAIISNSNNTAISNVKYHDSHNTSIYQHVHVYLNTHCNDTININEFIDGLEFTKAELDEMIASHSTPIHISIGKILKQKIKDMPTKERPLHCVKSTTTTTPSSSSIFVRDEDQWKEEDTHKTAEDIRYVEEYDDDTDIEDTPPEERTGINKSVLYKATKKLTNKMYDTTEELYTDKNELKEARRVTTIAGGCGTRGELVKSLERMPEISLDHGLVNDLI